MGRRGYRAYDAQRTYRAIEAENAREEIERTRILLSAPAAPLPQCIDDRDPYEIARAAARALESALTGVLG